MQKSHADRKYACREDLHHVRPCHAFSRFSSPFLAFVVRRQLTNAVESEPSASKITPVIIIEEPESFLHPSAQAEFGRVLHDFAEEFQVQVIVTIQAALFGVRKV